MPTVTLSSLTLASSLESSSAAHDIIAFSINLAGSAEGLYPLANIVNDAQLALLRAEGHKIRIWGSVLSPITLWSARINDSAMARSITTIAFDGGSGSNYSLVKAPQEVWVGTSAGANDIGRLRIKSITSGDGGVTGTLTVNYHPLILADDHYLTFKHDYPIRQKFPYIEENGTFKKDRDIAYSDQNLKPNPVLICGQDRAKWLTGASVDFAVDASESYAIGPGASISSYSLAVEPSTGSSVVFNSSTGVGTVTFTTTGQRWLRFSVTDSNGKTKTTFRNYWVHDPDPTAGDHPMFEYTGFRANGEWARGGYSAFFSVHNDAALSDIPDQTSILIWGDWEYGATQQAITLFPSPDTETIFNGFITRDTTNQDYKTGSGMVDFEIHTPQEMLRRFNFSVSLEVVEGVPDTWWKYDKSLTIGRAIHHLWEEHSTIFSRVDVIGLTNNTMPRGYSEFEEGDLYSMADGFAYQRGIRAHIVCDMGGRIHLTHDLQLLTDDERRQRKTAFEITDDDISGILELRREPIGRVAFVKTSGFAWDGESFITDANDQVIPDVEALCASAPGLMPADEGETAYLFDRQTFTSQDHANKIAGRVFAQQNNEYPSIPITFHGNYMGVFDIAYEHWYTLSLQATDTLRGVVFTDKKLICRSVAILINTGTGSVTVNANFEGEMEADIGVPAYCMDEIPDYGGELPPILDDDAPDALITGGTGSSIFFKPGYSKAWVKRSVQGINDLIQDPFWPLRTGTTASNDAILFKCGTGFIKRSIDGGQNWIDVTPTSDPPNNAGDSPAPTVSALEFEQMDGNWLYQGEFLAVANWQNTSNDWRSFLAYTYDDGTSWSWLSLATGESSLSFGTETEIHSSAYQWLGGTDSTSPRVPESIVTLSPTKAVVVEVNCVASLEYDIDATVVTIEGSTITPGSSSYKVHEALDPGTATDSKTIKTVALGSSKFAVAYIVWDDTQNEHYLYARVGTVLGTTISFGSETLIRDNVEPSEFAIAAIGSDDELAFVYAVLGVEKCRIAGISGTVITLLGSETNTPDALTTSHLVARKISTTNFILNHTWDGQKNACSIISHVGSGIINWGTKTVADSSVCDLLDIAMLSPTKFVLVYRKSSGGGNFGVYARCGTISGLTVSFPSSVVTLVSDGTFTGVTPMSSTSFMVAYNDVTGSTNDWFAIGRVSGTTISFDTPVEATGHTFNELGSLEVLSTSALFIKAVSGGSGACGYTLEGYIVSFSTFDALGTGLSIGKGFGDKVYVVAGDDTTLQLLEIFLPSLFIANRFSLGSTTWAQMASNTYIAYPFAGIGDDDWVIIYGRMNDPFSLGNPSYVLESLVGGATADLVDVDTTWTDGYCGALWMESDGLMYAIRNTGSQAKLYYGNYVIDLNLMSTLPFAAGVNPHAIKVDPFDLAVYASPDTPGSVMVVKSFPLYSNWIDMTYDHGTAGNVQSLELL